MIENNNRENISMYFRRGKHYLMQSNTCTRKAERINNGEYIVKAIGINTDFSVNGYTKHEHAAGPVPAQSRKVSVAN